MQIEWYDTVDIYLYDEVWPMCMCSGGDAGGKGVTWWPLCEERSGCCSRCC